MRVYVQAAQKMPFPGSLYILYSDEDLFRLSAEMQAFSPKSTFPRGEGRRAAQRRPYKTPRTEMIPPSLILIARAACNGKPFERADARIVCRSEVY